MPIRGPRPIFPPKGRAPTGIFSSKGRQKADSTTTFSNKDLLNYAYSTNGRLKPRPDNQSGKRHQSPPSR